MSKSINESFIVGFDISDDVDLSTMVVLRRDKDGLRQVNVLNGKDAEEFYYKLTKKEEK